MYSGNTNPDYFNLEHPPLGKYLIALSILACGDRPICWRLPGIIEAGLIPLMLGLALIASRYRVAKESARYLAGVTAALAASADPILYLSGSVAMLDIHLAFFEALAMSLFILGKRRLALVAAGLAFAVKFSGAGVILALMGYDVLTSPRLREGLRRVSEDILLPFITSIIALVPLFAYFGIRRLIVETINALKWHTTSRPPGPPTSTPLGWIVNSNPFYYSYYPVAMAGILNSVLHIAALLLLIPLIAYGLSRESPLIAAGPLLYTGVLAMYLIVWLLGNHTFYSFYAVQLTPAMALTIAGLILAVEVFCFESIEDRCYGDH
jgi:predicted membrane-bound dolichyl-phosphate-mannose-protein mannosyltransferase